jgi:signal transduction histidine kinase
VSELTEVLRGLPYFSDLSDELLQRVCDQSEQLDIPQGTVIIEEGSTSEEMYVVVSGEFSVTKAGSTRDVQLAVLTSGDVVGEIALLDDAPRTATVSAAIDSRVIRVPAAAFEELIGDARVVRRMFKTVTARLRGIEINLRHDERMAALGKMAAQLMHELNNPAAAVGRSAARASEVYEQLGAVSLELTLADIDVAKRLPEPELADLGPLERSDAEEAVAEFLVTLGVEEAWDTAPALIAEGFSLPALEKAVAGLDPADAAVLTRWLGMRCLTGQILGELRIAANRVSDLVRVVKGYSFLDQAPVQNIEVTEGIGDTLILLKPKLREVAVTTDYEPDLPQIEAAGRDLNQVWTNLIDNASDAMEGSGELRISASSADGEVIVEVADDGAGMDPETAQRIFDPFFTTKEPGKGTGLGLHTVHTIVQRSGGEITVSSSPEGTTFRITFPAIPDE